MTNQPPFDGSILTYFIAQLYVPSTLSLNKTKVINLIYLPDKDVFVEYYTTKKIERLVKWTLLQGTLVRMFWCSFVFSMHNTQKVFNPETNHSLKATMWCQYANIPIKNAIFKLFCLPHLNNLQKRNWYVCEILLLTV